MQRVWAATLHCELSFSIRADASFVVWGKWEVLPRENQMAFQLCVCFIFMSESDGSLV